MKNTMHSKNVKKLGLPPSWQRPPITTSLIWPIHLYYHHKQFGRETPQLENAHPLPDRDHNLF